MNTAIIGLSRNGKADLTRLARKVHAKGGDEVIANALSLYAFVLRQLAGRPELSLAFSIKANGERIPEKLILVSAVRNSI